MYQFVLLSYVSGLQLYQAAHHLSDSQTYGFINIHFIACFLPTDPNLSFHYFIIDNLEVPFFFIVDETY